MAVVIFNVDQTPYCKGDEVNLSDDQLKAVDAVAKERGVKQTYSVVEEAAPVAPEEVEVETEPKVDEQPAEVPAEEAAPAKAKSAKGGK